MNRSTSKNSCWWKIFPVFFPPWNHASIPTTWPLLWLFILMYIFALPISWFPFSNSAFDLNVLLEVVKALTLTISWLLALTIKKYFSTSHFLRASAQIKRGLQYLLLKRRWNFYGSKNTKFSILKTFIVKICKATIIFTLTFWRLHTCFEGLTTRQCKPRTYENCASLIDDLKAKTTCVEYPITLVSDSSIFHFTFR